ncbi:HupE/UreJ family protein [Tistrella mobilis]|uniref:HupE/UreJ family protein n=1 Tax=Tistrella mobilis TaxID=171437 RepID=UPI0031F61512
MFRRSLILPLTAAAALVAGPAFAHTGHEVAGFMSGFAHPIGGLDHVLAMLAVGFWAGQTGGRMIWAAPLGFMALMIAGGALGMAGIGLPGVELGIVASIVVFGLMIAFAFRPNPVAAAAIAGVFALFHGHAHGTEMAGDGSAALYALGFLAATGLLHLAGIGIAMGLQKLQVARVERLIGAGIAAAGLVLMVG